MCDRNMYRNNVKAVYLELLMALYKNNSYIRCTQCKIQVKFFFCFLIHHSIEQMTAIMNISFKTFLDAVLGPKNQKYFPSLKNHFSQWFSVKCSFQTQDIVYLTLKGYILVQLEMLNPNVSSLTF